MPGKMRHLFEGGYYSRAAIIRGAHVRTLILSIRKCYEYFPFIFRFNEVI